MPAPRKSPAPIDARRDLQKELAAAAALKHQLAEAFGDEPDLVLLRDMVEGETSLHEVIDAALEQMLRDVANVEGLITVEKKMEARRKRFEDRVDTMRAMLLNAMDILEERSIDRPLARITLKSLAPKLLITDEAAIPTRFYKQPDPELSKRDLTDALKDRRDTLADKLGEITAAIESGVITSAQADEQRERVHAAFPGIPGAELDNGNASIQIKWS